MIMKDQTPIIIRRKPRRAHGGHHGGAWKVAYADFVTALMAFFLVMWIVGMDPAIRKAVAAYFRDPGVFELSKSGGLLPPGGHGLQPAQKSIVERKGSQINEAARMALLNAADRIRNSLVRLPEFKNVRDQVEIEVTSGGLRVELIDSFDNSFFELGSATLKPNTEKVLAAIAAEVGELNNDVLIEGHTDSLPYADTDGYTNWELSADRANAARRLMQRHGLHAAQLRGVRACGDTELRIKNDPLDARNRRVSILVQYASEE